MIKTVLFDLGNVLLPFDVMRLANGLTRHCPFSAEEIINKLWNDHIANHFETGRMSPSEYFAHVSDLCQFSDLSFEEFVPIFNEIFEEDKDVFGLLPQLKNRYKLGLISNTNAIHVSYILENYPGLAHFDRHWFSNEAGVRKPNPTIYEMALTHFSVQPSESVFIDDMAVNIASAQELGMNTILFQGFGHLRKELVRLGVEI